MAKNHKVVFKAYSPAQFQLLPPSLDELIAAHHPVRIVNQVIDSVDLRLLEQSYKGGGASSFHPRMLLKVLVYGYLSNIYSSRKLEAALKENIPFMWLAGMQQPDHHTINRFRGERLQHTLKDIFTQVVELLVVEGVLNIRDIYVDGTKIEAAANRYTFVWGKAIKTSRDKIKAQLEALWQYAQQLTKEEELLPPDPPDFTVISKEKVQAAIEQIGQALKDKAGVSKGVKQKLNYAKNNWPAALDKYEVQEVILAGRNSYSKTDTDATFMRMKEDHMGNGQLKPAYNLQMSTANQFIVLYSIHNTPGDITTLPQHLQHYESSYHQYPQIVTADAGYGSEENYRLLEDNQIEGYVKYSSFDRQQRDNYNSRHPFATEELYYNTEQDCYYCPMGQPMTCIGEEQRKTSTGFEQTITRYQAQRCEGCPLRGACHKGKGKRIIEINKKGNRYRAIAAEKLKSEAGIAHRKQRCWDVEAVFGNIKSNHGFKRFMLRGKEKVSVEVGLLAIAQNMRKKAVLQTLEKAKEAVFPLHSTCLHPCSIAA